jgi:hypothetical protein
MRIKFIYPAVIALSAVALSPVVFAQSGAPTQMAIETAYQGTTPAMRDVERNFDWDAHRAAISDVEKRTVPNVTKFLFKSKAELEAQAALAVPDPLLNPTTGTRVDLKNSFEGTSDADNLALTGVLLVPPDTNGDAGKDYYCQMNNIVFECFDKKNGASVLGPLPNNAFWTGTGSFCEAFNDGDPVVLYDHDAERWIFTQFAIFEFIPSLGQFVSHQCFAVSQTDDPAGAYFLYDFIYSVPTFGGFAALNDYPKVTVWPDGYYISVNEFEIGLPVQFVGASLGVVDRAAMLAGAPAGGVKWYLPYTGAAPVHFSLQPSHWEASRHAPPAGSPNIYVQAFDDDTWGNGGGQDGYYHWAVSVNFPGGPFSLTHLGLIPSAAFDSNLCNFADCIPQPPPATGADVLDTLSQFTMYRASYQHFVEDDDGGTRHESLVVSHSVDADGADTAGMRWAELRDSGGGWVVHQAGTYAPPDGENRWMGAASMNQSGDIALGYSVSSTSTFPSVRMAGRRKNDPLGQLGAETECHAGTGSQLGSANRWGDYSSMSVDPKDNTTFWYTQEYYETSGSFDFNTRVCSFKLTSSNASGE